MTTYAIDTGHGDLITTGLAEHEAERVARRIATERGETVYLYEVGSTEEPEAIEPAA